MTDAGKEPFRWWCLDDVIPTVSKEMIPPPSWEGWEVHYKGEAELGKRTTRKLQGVPEVAAIVESLRARRVTMEWGMRLGYPVTDDPTLHGGGLHVTGPGGRLQVHLDYDRHPILKGKRRAINLIGFIHDEWYPEWGGDLVLCDSNGVVAKRFYPKPGRLVAFETSDVSFHGVEPITKSHPVERVSVAVYFLVTDQFTREVDKLRFTRTKAMFLPVRE